MKLETILLVALMGFVIGALMGLSVKHITTAATIAKFDTTCSGAKPESYKTGLTGEVYSVKCANGQVIKISH